MSHINHEFGAHKVGNLPKTLKINHPGVSASPGHNQLGLMFQSKFFHLMVVNPPRLPLDTIMYETVRPAREAYPRQSRQDVERQPLLAVAHGSQSFGQVRCQRSTRPNSIFPSSAKISIRFAGPNSMNFW